MSNKLCPLRKLVKSADFEECYKEQCEWWIDCADNDEPHCAILKIADKIDDLVRRG